jgi:hypothetical protein
LIKVGKGPALLQHVDDEEFQAIQVQLDRTPGMRSHQTGEIVQQLLLGQVVNAMGKVGADAPYGAGIGFDGLGRRP